MSLEPSHIRIALALIYSTLNWVFGGFDYMFYALLTFMVLDYISGIFVAIKTKKLSSNIGFRGIGKKVMILVMVAVGNLIDIAIIGSGHTCRTLVIAFYSANEAISILENASNLGLPLPEKIKAVLEQLGEHKNFE
ncbi:MAG: phage holin family protein [Oscillospiraceae bacterium]|nr:phage holin family protein [Oscillospiraceae bacterium]